MSQFVEGNHKAFTPGSTAIPQYSRVKLSSGVLVAAGVTDAELGVVARATFTNQTAPVDVHLRTASGTTPMIAAGAITAGATVYAAASGQVSSTQATGALKIGISIDAASGAGGIVEVLRQAYEA